MKGTALICILLTLIVALLGAQSYVLWQKTQTLEASLSDALDGLSDVQESLGAIAEASETFGGIWSRLSQEGGLLGFLRQP